MNWNHIERGGVGVGNNSKRRGRQSTESAQLNWPTLRKAERKTQEREQVTWFKRRAPNKHWLNWFLLFRFSIHKFFFCPANKWTQFGSVTQLPIVQWFSYSTLKNRCKKSAAILRNVFSCEKVQHIWVLLFLAPKKVMLCFSGTFTQTFSFSEKKQCRAAWAIYCTWGKLLYIFNRTIFLNSKTNFSFQCTMLYTRICLNDVLNFKQNTNDLLLKI